MLSSVRNTANERIFKNNDASGLFASVILNKMVVTSCKGARLKKKLCQFISRMAHDSGQVPLGLLAAFLGGLKLQAFELNVWTWLFMRYLNHKIQNKLSRIVAYCGS